MVEVGREEATVDDVAAGRGGEGAHPRGAAGGGQPQPGVGDLPGGAAGRGDGGGGGAHGRAGVGAERVGGDGRHRAPLAAGAARATWAERAGTRCPGPRSLVLERLRELLFDAREYDKRKGDFEQNRMRLVAASRLDLESLQPALAGTLPVVVTANRVSDIRAALALGREFGLKLVHRRGARGVDGGAGAGGGEGAGHPAADAEPARELRRAEQPAGRGGAAERRRG